MKLNTSKVIEEWAKSLPENEAFNESYKRVHDLIGADDIPLIHELVSRGYKIEFGSKGEITASKESNAR